MNHTDIILQGQRYIQSKQLFKRTIKNAEIFQLNKIISFLGGRRTGKTSLMIQLIQEMIAKNEIKLEQVIFIDFSQLENHHINIIAIYEEYTKNGILPFFILDEIQELPEFEKPLGFLYQQGCKIFVSGSNSRLLSQEISTKLRGRGIEYHNDILSFQEFLTFKGYDGDLVPNLTIQSFFEEYLMWGGYPEVVIASANETKLALLQSYFDLIIYRDIIDRYRIRNPEILGHLIKSLIISNTKQLNINKLYNTYKSLGYEVSKNTLYQYSEYLENNFFISKVKNFYKKSYFDKVYVIDNGYMNLFDTQENYGQKFENIVYKYLKTHNRLLGYSEDTYECDFTNGKTNRQACYKITPENMKRELAFEKSDKENIILYTINTLGNYSNNKINFQNYLTLIG